MIKYKELITKLNRKEIVPSYFFCGEEDYLKQEAILLLKKILVAPGAEQFDFNLLYAEDTSAREAISLLETRPFISEKRLIVIREMDGFLESELKEIIEYLRKPVSYACLILMTEKVKGGASDRSLYRDIASLCETVIFWRLFDSDIPGWIEDRVVGEGKIITSEASHYLVAEVGNNLLDLSGEIEKLLIYTGDRRQITLDDIRKLIGHSRSDSIFDLLRAVTRKNLKQSMMLLSKLIENGEDPAWILVRLANRIRQIIRAKELLDQEVAPLEIVKELGLHPFFDKDFPSEVRNFNWKELLNNLRTLLQADWEVKVGKKPAQLALELAILSLCGEKKRAPYPG